MKKASIFSDISLGERQHPLSNVYNPVRNIPAGKDGKRMNISADRSAPVFASSETVIDAPLSKVWDTLTDIHHWPQWQSSVTQTVLGGPIHEGTAFDWKADGISFRSQIHTMKLNEEFGWTGRAIGASAVHNWRFTQQDSATVVKVEESLRGLLPALFKKYFQKNLDKGILKNLRELKAASEKTS